MSLSPDAIKVSIIVIVFFVLSSLAVIARLWSRRLQRLRLSFNDYAIVLALIFSASVAGLFLAVSFAGNLGKHLMEATPSQIALFIKVFVSCQPLWAAANTCVKLSILDLYIHLFPSTAMRGTCYTIIVLTLCYFLSVFLETFLLCHPVSYNWDKTIIGGYCKDQNQAYLGAGISNLLIDTLVVVTPMPVLWGLHMSWRKKIGIIGMFSLGTLVCIISLQRVLWLQNWNLADLTYTATPGAIWSILEPCLGIVNACLPVMQPALRKVFRMDTIRGTRISNTDYKNQEISARKRNWSGKDRRVSTQVSCYGPSWNDNVESPDLELAELPTAKRDQAGSETSIGWMGKKYDSEPLVASNAIQLTKTWIVKGEKQGPR